MVARYPKDNMAGLFCFISIIVIVNQIRLLTTLYHPSFESKVGPTQLGEGFILFY